jgi:tRNA threonylcarbamoyladenosine biosynthesis protein TsaB
MAPMKILAIETSGEHGSVALVADETLLEWTLEGHARHSEHLLPTIRQLLAEAGLSLQQLDALAFGAGPGAFTGLRLACGVAQGLALGAGLPVVAVGSLQALALEAPMGPVLVAADARMGEIYSAAYLNDGVEPVEVQAPRCGPPEALRLPGIDVGHEGAWIGVGSGFAAYPERIPDALRQGLSSVDGHRVPTARAVARLAALGVIRGETVPVAQAAPLYVRDKVALTTVERLARGARG